MQSHRLAGYVLLSLLSACGEDRRTEPTLTEPDHASAEDVLPSDAGEPSDAGDASDAGHASDAGAPAMSSAAWPFDSGLPPFVPPTEPRTFRLSHGSSDCYGSCPSYRVAIDETGRVEYAGDVCTERPGTFTRQLSPSAARGLYDEFVRLRFWDFGPRYSSKADGCVDVFTDSATASYTAVVDGHSHSSTRYDGCRGVPWLAGLDELGTKIDLATEVQRWLGEPGAGGCVVFGPSIQLEASYLLRREETTLGLLSLDTRATTWTLTACSGAVLAKGKLLTTAARATLLDVDSLPITLPLDVGDVASIVIDRYPGGEPSARALRARPEDDVPLTLVSASGC